MFTSLMFDIVYSFCLLRCTYCCVVLY